MNELLTCEGLTKSYQKGTNALDNIELHIGCLLYTSPSPRD